MSDSVTNDRLEAALEFGRQHKRKQFVYAIQCNEFVKLGIAFDVEARLAMLQTGRPYTLRLVGKYSCADALAVERLLHAKLRKHNHSGEWFALPPEDIAALAGLVKLVDEQVDQWRQEPRMEAQPTLRTMIDRPERKPKPGRPREPRPLTGYWLKDAQRSMNIVTE